MVFLEKATNPDMVFLEKADNFDAMNNPKVTNFHVTGYRNTMSHTLLSGHSDMVFLETSQDCEAAINQITNLKLFAVTRNTMSVNGMKNRQPE